ncbi:MAG: OmpA family protein [Flavobacteriales bacterium]
MKNALGISALVAALACASAPLMGQSLLRDGSFEERAYCPSAYNTTELRTFRHWQQATKGTPDHFEQCSSGSSGVPDNVAGSQLPHDGSGYSGVITYTSTKRDYREYLQAKLERKLAGGEMVCVELWLSCGDFSLYVTDAFGVHFSKEPLKHGTFAPLNVKPQVKNPRLHLIDNVTDWVKISDTFIAEGGEEYVTLGNFLPDDLITRLKRTTVEGAKETSKWHYVYIDQVTVRPVKDRSECSCVNDKIAAEVHDPPLQLSDYEELVLNTVYFAFDDSTLDDRARRDLDEVASVLRRTPYTFVKVMGHTDIIGRDGYNVDLSANRARSVMNYLTYIGVDPKRLELGFFGSEEPAADNTTPEGRAQNRRVEFSVLRRKFVMEGRD